MLWVHEVHRVRGAQEDEFDAACRDEWMPALAATGDAKLLYFAHLTHGSGRAYTVITVTAVPDGAAWGNVAQRVQSGDLLTTMHYPVPTEGTPRPMQVLVQMI